MPCVVWSIVCAEQLPRQQITLGLITPSWRKQIGRAGGDFVFFREAIFGRAAFDDIADVDVGAAQAHGFDHLREEFSGTADERLALQSSSRPGPSPTKTSCAFGLPTPKTIWVRALWSLQRVQFGPMSSTDARKSIVFDVLLEKGGAGRNLNGTVTSVWHDQPQELKPPGLRLLQVRAGAPTLTRFSFSGMHCSRADGFRRGRWRRGADAIIGAEAEVCCVAEPCFCAGASFRIHESPVPSVPCANYFFGFTSA